MALIVIILSLLVERVFGHLQHLRRLDWFPGYRARLFAWLPDSFFNGLPGVFIILAPVVLLMFAVQMLFQGTAWGFFELLLGVAVVSYCLGPEAFNEQVDEYLQACEDQDHARARKLAEALVGNSISEDIHQQAGKVTKAILYEGHSRIFAVLFWYVLLGPTGALLYRVMTFFVQDSKELDIPQLARAAEKVHQLLDWLPAHILSLTFFLTGSFDDALKGWQAAKNDNDGSTDISRAILVGTGCGAMQLEINDSLGQSASGRNSQEYDLQSVRTARALVIRSLVVWLAVIALMTLAGWFV